MSRPAHMQSDRGNPRLKFLDRYLGIPIVGVLGVAHRLRGRHAVPETWSSIGILLTAGIGDAVVATGVLADLRAEFPDARIVLFVTANNASFARLLTVPDEIVELPVRQVWRAVREVRARDLDLIVDLGAWRRFDAVLARLGGARAAIGLRTPGQHRHYAYDVVVDHQRRHEIENDRRLVAALGLVSNSEPSVPMPATTAPLADPYVVFHLWPGGANFEERSWPIESWKAVAAEMAARGFTIVLTGGPNEFDITQTIVDDWTAAGIPVRNAASGSWSESLAWLAGSAGVVSVNTGVMHVAAAVGAPTVALNGPTSGTRWGPRGPFTRCVASPMVPDGYLNLGFEHDDRFARCMEAITVPMVLEAWDSLRAEASIAGR
ncbi:MAG: glycosyltransferase family 9 protein [Acidimicrobiia bacterium]